MNEEQMEQMDEITRARQEEEAAAQQEAYYWYVLQEFAAVCKVFGQTKVLRDLKLVRETLENKQEKKHIITL
jgi:hypothetical protein